MTNQVFANVATLSLREMISVEIAFPPPEIGSGADCEVHLYSPYLFFIDSEQEFVYFDFKILFHFHWRLSKLQYLWHLELKNKL